MKRMSEISAELLSTTKEIRKPEPQTTESDGGVRGKEPISEIDKAKKELIDPRAISKKHDSEGRSATVSAILQTRKKLRFGQKNVSEREDQLQQTRQRVKELYQLEGQTTRDLDEKSRKLSVRLKKIFRIKDKEIARLQAELGDITSEQNNRIAKLAEIEGGLEALRKRQAETPDAKTLLESYYETVQFLPLTNEEKREQLVPEALASLSTEEYVALWRRLNPHFLSHVTRQGFRDHNAMMYHTAGLKEFHSGLLSALEDDKLLRPPFALHGLRARDKASVKEFLGEWVLQAKDKKEAEERFNSILNFSLAAAPNYPDKTAVHFATQLVADDYYGGEGGNEIFFIYPSDAVASQYTFAFNGREKDLTRPQNETKWNDVFVWPPTLDNPGIPIDAGFVFLPEITPVDPKTGSKYASEIVVVEGQEKRTMIEDKKLVSAFIEWGQDLNDQSLAKRAFVEYNEERNYYKRLDLEKTCLAVFARELQKLGFAADASVAVGRRLLGELYLRDDLTEEGLQDILRKSSANWKRAEDAIPSKKYWENYFAKNPHFRPKHMIFYEGDPTAAVYSFLQENNIGRADVSETEGDLLGFGDHHVVNMEKDPRAYLGYDELVEMANKIIFAHYDSTKKS